MKNRNRSVLITGCSSGIGKATAIFLRSKGWTVYATARKEGDVRSLCQDGFDGLQLDVDDSVSIKKAVDIVLRKNGGILGAVINNAGYSLVKAVEDLTREDMRDQFETNVFGAIELTSFLIPVMKRQGYGHIVFISSVNGRFTFPYMGAYCASKHAIESFCDALRRELTGTNIAVTAVEPGLFKTNAIENSRKKQTSTVSQEKNPFTAIYDAILTKLQNAVDRLPPDRMNEMMLSIWKILEADHPSTRVIVPKLSYLYDIAHRFFPDKFQDYLLRLKSKFTYP